MFFSSKVPSVSHLCVLWLNTGPFHWERLARITTIATVRWVPLLLHFPLPSTLVFEQTGLPCTWGVFFFFQFWIDWKVQHSSPLTALVLISAPPAAVLQHRAAEAGDDWMSPFLGSCSVRWTTSGLAGFSQYGSQCVEGTTWQAAKSNLGYLKNSAAQSHVPGSSEMK